MLFFTLSACSTPIVEDSKLSAVQKYSDNSISFEFPTSGYVETYSGYEIVNFEPFVNKLEGKTEIFLVDVETQERKSVSSISYWKINGDNDVENFVHEIFGNDCGYSLRKVDAVDLISPYYKGIPDDDLGPVCGGFVFQIMRKDNLLVYYFGGQECGIYDKEKYPQECLEGQIYQTLRFVN